jgi:hypothetical protein
MAYGESRKIAGEHLQAGAAGVRLSIHDVCLAILFLRFGGDE